MLNADLVFTSAGRTTYELALLGVPTIVLAQNEREMTHYFAGSEFGFEFLGLGIEQSSEDIFSSFQSMFDHKIRIKRSELMLSFDLKEGKSRVLKLINELLN